MRLRKQQRLILVVVAVLLLGGASGLVLFALSDSVAFFVTPSDIATGKVDADKRFRLGVVVGLEARPDRRPCAAEPVAQLAKERRLVAVAGLEQGFELAARAFQIERRRPLDDLASLTQLNGHAHTCLREGAAGTSSGPALATAVLARRG